MHTLAPVTPDHPTSSAKYGSVFRIESLPDSDDPVFRLMAGGDVSRAVKGCHELILRTLALYPAGSATLAMRFAFAPAVTPSRRQERLTITMHVAAHDAEAAHTLRLLIECSDLARYYEMLPQSSYNRPSLPVGASCYITRAEQAIRPLHPPEDNPAIPPAYYGCRPFEPTSHNDHRVLDRILDRLTEPVFFDLVVEPVDVAQERFMHSRYMSRLQSINRFHGYDDEDGCTRGDPFEHDAYSRSGHTKVVQPFRRRDPIADDMLLAHRRFHESLSLPHLAFRMRTTASTPAIARLVASVIAESAFEAGSYHLWPGGAESTQHDVADLCNAGLAALPTLDVVLGAHAAAYRGFRRLAHIATIDELLSACVLPVASGSTFRCIRRNTDPPLVPSERLLVFGHDE